MPEARVACDGAANGSGDMQGGEGSITAEDSARYNSGWFRTNSSRWYRFLKEQQVGRLNIRRLGYALGAEVTGVNLRERLDAGTISDIRAAWLEHIVLCFPGQDLDPSEM